MLKFNCEICHENVFEVNGVEHLVPLPHEITCSGCGKVYVCMIDGKGNLGIRRKGTKRTRRLLRPIES